MSWTNNKVYQNTLNVKLDLEGFATELLISFLMGDTWY